MFKIFWNQKKMDKNIVTFVVEYYEYLSHSVRDISNLYVDGAKIILFQGKEQEKVYVTNYERILISGPRKVKIVSGHVIGNRLYVHVQSEVTKNAKKLVLDEAFICVMNDTSILIQYQTIHVNPLLDPVEVVLPPPLPKVAPAKPKVEKKQAEEVATHEPMKKSNCIIVNNLPFRTPPKEFLPVMEKHGTILRFLQLKGRLVVEYEKIEDVYKAKDGYYSEWNGRTPKVFRPPKDYNWDQL